MGAFYDESKSNLGLFVLIDLRLGIFLVVNTQVILDVTL